MRKRLERRSNGRNKKKLRNERIRAYRLQRREAYRKQEEAELREVTSEIELERYKRRQARTKKRSDDLVSLVVAKQHAKESLQRRVAVAIEAADVRFACYPAVAKRAREASSELLRFDVKRAGGIAQKIAMTRCPVALSSAKTQDAGASGGPGAGLGFSPAYVASLPSSDPSAGNVTAKLSLVLASSAVRGHRALPTPSAFARSRLDGWQALAHTGPDAAGDRASAVLAPLMKDLRGINASRHIDEAVRAVVGSIGDGAAALPPLSAAQSLDTRLKEIGACIKAPGSGAGRRLGSRAGGVSSGGGGRDGSVATTLAASVRAWQPTDGPALKPHAALRLARVCVELYLRYRGFLPALMEAVCDAAADAARVLEAGGGPVGPGEVGAWETEEARRRRAARIMFRMRGRGAGRSEAEAAAIRFEMKEQVQPAAVPWSCAGLLGVLSRIKAGLGNKRECADLDKKAEGVGPVTGNGGGAWLGRDAMSAAGSSGGKARGSAGVGVAAAAGASLVAASATNGEDGTNDKSAGSSKGKGKGKGASSGRGGGGGGGGGGGTYGMLDDFDDLSSDSGSETDEEGSGGSDSDADGEGASPCKAGEGTSKEAHPEGSPALGADRGLRPSWCPAAPTGDDGCLAEAERRASTGGLVAAVSSADKAGASAKAQGVTSAAAASAIPPPPTSDDAKVSKRSTWAAAAGAPVSEAESSGPTLGVGKVDPRLLQLPPNVSLEDAARALLNLPLPDKPGAGNAGVQLARLQQLQRDWIDGGLWAWCQQPATRRSATDRLVALIVLLLGLHEAGAWRDEDSAAALVAAAIGEEQVVRQCLQHVRRVTKDIEAAGSAADEGEGAAVGDAGGQAGSLATRTQAPTGSHAGVTSDPVATDPVADDDEGDVSDPEIGSDGKRLPSLPDRPPLVLREPCGPGSRAIEERMRRADTAWIARQLEQEAASESMVQGWDEEERKKKQEQKQAEEKEKEKAKQSARGTADPRPELLPLTECSKAATCLPLALPLLSVAAPLLAGVAPRRVRTGAEKLAPNDRWLQAPAAHWFLGLPGSGSKPELEEPKHSSHLASTLWVGTGLTRARLLAVADRSYDALYSLLARRFGELCRLEREAEVEALTRGAIEKQLRERIAGAREAVRVADDAVRTMGDIIDRTYCPPPQPTLQEDEEAEGALVLQLWQGAGNDSDEASGAEALRELYGDETTAALYRDLMDLQAEFPTTVFPGSHSTRVTSEGGSESPSGSQGAGPPIDLSWEDQVSEAEDGDPGAAGDPVATYGGMDTTVALLHCLYRPSQIGSRELSDTWCRQFVALGHNTARGRGMLAFALLEPAAFLRRFPVPVTKEPSMQVQPWSNSLLPFQARIVATLDRVMPGFAAVPLRHVAQALPRLAQIARRQPWAKRETAGMRAAYAALRSQPDAESLRKRLAGMGNESASERKRRRAMLDRRRRMAGLLAQLCWFQLVTPADALGALVERPLGLGLSQSGGPDGGATTPEAGSGTGEGGAGASGAGDGTGAGSDAHASSSSSSFPLLEDRILASVAAESLGRMWAQAAARGSKQQESDSESKSSKHEHNAGERDGEQSPKAASAVQTPSLAARIRAVQARFDGLSSRAGGTAGGMAEADPMGPALSMIQYCPVATAMLAESIEACIAASSALKPDTSGGAAAAARLARKAAWARLPPPIAFIRATIEKSLKVKTASSVASLLKRVPLSREMRYSVRLTLLDGSEGAGASHPPPASGAGAGGPADVGASASSGDVVEAVDGAGASVPVRHGSVSGALLQAQIVTSLLRLGRQRQEDAQAVALVCDRLRRQCPLLVQAVADAVATSFLSAAWEGASQAGGGQDQGQGGAQSSGGADLLFSAKSNRNLRMADARLLGQLARCGVISERAFFRVLYGLLSQGHEAGGMQAVQRAMGLLAMRDRAGGVTSEKSPGPIPGHLVSASAVTSSLGGAVGLPTDPAAAEAVLQRLTSSRAEEQEEQAALQCDAACTAGGVMSASSRRMARLRVKDAAWALLTLAVAGLGPRPVVDASEQAVSDAAYDGTKREAVPGATAQQFRLGGGWASHPLIPCAADPPTSFLRPVLVCTALQSRWPRAAGVGSDRSALVEASGKKVTSAYSRRLLRLLCYLQLHALAKAAVGVSAEQLYSDTLERFRDVLEVPIADEMPHWAGTTRSELREAVRQWTQLPSDKRPIVQPKLPTFRFRSFDAAQKVCMVLEAEEALAWWGWCSAHELGYDAMPGSSQGVTSAGSESDGAGVRKPTSGDAGGGVVYSDDEGDEDEDDDDDEEEYDEEEEEEEEYDEEEDDDDTSDDDAEEEDNGDAGSVDHADSESGDEYDDGHGWSNANASLFEQNGAARTTDGRAVDAAPAQSARGSGARRAVWEEEDEDEVESRLAKLMMEASGGGSTGQRSGGSRQMQEVGKVAGGRAHRDFSGAQEASSVGGWLERAAIADAGGDAAAGLAAARSAAGGRGSGNATGISAVRVLRQNAQRATPAALGGSIAGRQSGAQSVKVLLRRAGPGTSGQGRVRSSTDMRAVEATVIMRRDPVKEAASSAQRAGYPEDGHASLAGPFDYEAGYEREVEDWEM